MRRVAGDMREFVVLPREAQAPCRERGDERLSERRERAGPERGVERAVVEPDRAVDRAGGERGADRQQAERCDEGDEADACLIWAKKRDGGATTMS